MTKLKFENPVSGVVCSRRYVKVKNQYTVMGRTQDYLITCTRRRATCKHITACILKIDGK